MKTKTPRVVIAGLRGGSGKTTLSVGLSSALAARGYRVAAFKKGPDYIDAGWLAAASGSPCYNLDPFLIGMDRVPQSFIERSRKSDISIIEGNRGLFDGMDVEGTISTSRVARILKSPVLLIVDCTKATRTVAAMVLGAKKFERGLDLAGVVLNNFRGARHEAVVRESIEHYTGIPVLGAIPRLRGSELPERHMGLVTWREHPDFSAAVGVARGIVESHVDVDAIAKVARRAGLLESKRIARSRGAKTGKGLRIGVLRDSAFQFYYEENMEALAATGAEIVLISSITSRELPKVDALYIGGGFPETHAIALAKNRSFRASVLKAARGGLPIYAECGGLMFLGKALVLDGKRYPMTGVFPLTFTMGERPKAHGYSVVEVVARNPFYPVGAELHGHEFHYSVPEAGHEIEGSEEIAMCFRMHRGAGIYADMDGICRWNVLATYTHTHALGCPEWADGMIRAALALTEK